MLILITIRKKNLLKEKKKTLLQKNKNKNKIL